MKPLTVQQADREILEELGRASVQVVHDLKNQLNGLKLYATFLRKRLQKREAAADELETIEKLMAGLERATADANVLVHLGRPLELKTQPSINLRKLLRAVANDEELRIAHDAEDIAGSYDVPRLTEALRYVTERVRATTVDATQATVALTSEPTGDRHTAQIEWRGGTFRIDEDLFTPTGGSANLRLALARRIIEAHGGTIERAEDNNIVVRLPIN